jgi:hypothetical protein
LLSEANQHIMVKAEAVYTGDRRNRCNSLVIKILTSKSFALKILRAILARRARQLRLFKDVEKGVPGKPQIFPEWNSREARLL